ncbi:MAG: hypothetical protein ACKOBG_00890 [Actinomycetota bacterium]
MKTRRRWLLGSFSGFGFGLSIAIVLLGSGAFPLDSPWLIWAPIIGLAVGIGGALWAPRSPQGVSPLARATLARRSGAAVPPASPEVWAEPAPDAPDAAPPIDDSTTPRA